MTRRMDLLVNILIGAMIAATPLLLAATGELVTERAGVLNLGVEGMMIVGAIAGFSAMIARNSSRGRVFATWRASSHPRRAMLVPQMTLSHSDMEWASESMVKRQPASSAARARRSSRSSRSSEPLTSSRVPVSAASA